MKTIPFDESARDVEHDASVEVPNNMRDVLVSSGDGWDEIGYYTADGNTWGASRVVKVWRELPAPPKPTQTIVPHSLEHWHDPKVERPEDGRPFVVITNTGYVAMSNYNQCIFWDTVVRWAYAQEFPR